MSDQASEAIAYIEREYEDLKGRVEDQRRVVEQLHMVETDAAEAEASLAALLDEEASKLRILDYLRTWRGDKCRPNAVEFRSVNCLNNGRQASWPQPRSPLRLFRHHTTELRLSASTISSQAQHARG